MSLPVIIGSVVAALPALFKKNTYNLWIWEPTAAKWYLEQTGKARALKKYAKDSLIPNKIIYRIYSLSIKPIRPPK